MIEVINVSKAYQTDSKNIAVIKNLSFTINDNEVFGIIGSSGVGKSTLLRLLNGLASPDSGEIKIDDVLVSPTNKQMYQTTSFVFQDYNLLFNKTIIDNILLPLKMRKITNDDINYAKELIKLVGLTNKDRQYPNTLSGGQQQRVAIARALITKPKVIFFDEPTSALDINNAKEILDLLLVLKQKFNLTIVLVSHQINVIKYICNRLLWLEDGTIKKIGQVKNENLLTNDWGQVFYE